MTNGIIDCPECGRTKHVDFKCPQCEEPMTLWIKDWASEVAEKLCWNDCDHGVSEIEVAVALRKAFADGEDRIMGLMTKHVNECGCNEAFNGYCPELIKAIYNRNKEPTP